MQISDVKAVVGDLPHMSDEQAQQMTEIVLREKPLAILELGTKHGVSSCYMAAALDEIGGGHITTIDLKSAEALEPNVTVLLERLGLSRYVTPIFEETSYVWSLMAMLEQETRPMFDLCYLDGAHSWNDDGFAFFLFDKLLNPGGFVIFDDIDWRYSTSPSLKDTDLVRGMPERERSCFQMRKVFELLVQDHPNYDDFEIDGEWAFARKRLEAGGAGAVQIKKEIVYREVPVGVGGAMVRAARKAKRALSG